MYVVLIGPSYALAYLSFIHSRPMMILQSRTITISYIF